MVATSDGGHWIQMRRILPAFEGLDVCYVGVAPEPDADMRAARYYCVRNATRRNPHWFAVIVWQLVRIVLKERPDVVVTTGAGPGLMALAVGKALVRSRTLWIDSVANSERLSLSGRLARPIADVHLVQWPHLARPNGPEYWGAVF